MISTGTDDLLRLSRERADFLEADNARLREALHVIRDAHAQPDRPGASCAEGCFGRWPCVAWFEADVALSTPDRGDDDE